MCDLSTWSLVYFDADNKKYLTSDIKVAVHQKVDDVTIPFAIALIGQKEKLRSM